MKLSPSPRFAGVQLFSLVALLTAFAEATYAQNPDILQAAKKEGENAHHQYWLKNGPDNTNGGLFITDFKIPPGKNVK